MFIQGAPLMYDAVAPCPIVDISDDIGSTAATFGTACNADGAFYTPLHQVC
jgi:hypothetical protein